jgi:hypothetical protein
VCPTAKQISSNLIVVPKRFVVENPHSINWRGFDVSFLGQLLKNKKLDSESRVSLPLNGRIQPGQTLGLRVEPGLLVIEAERG